MMDEMKEIEPVRVTGLTWKFKAWTGPTVVASVRECLGETATGDERIVEIREGTEHIWIEVKAATAADARSTVEALSRRGEREWLEWKKV